jgi:hypothetical protein
MQDRYAAAVIGPAAIFPRGYLWLSPVWCGAAVAAVALSPQPAWFRLVAATALAGALITLLAVLGTVRTNAFLAAPAGLWLGPRGGARRRWRRGRIRHLAWTEIAQIRLRSVPSGAVVEIIAGPGGPGGPGGPATARPAWRRATVLAGRWLLLLLLPPAYLCCRPAVACPAGNPPRYRVPVRAVRVQHAAAALRAIAPAGVAVTVLTRRAWTPADLVPGDLAEPAPVMAAPGG